MIIFVHVYPCPCAINLSSLTFGSIFLPKWQIFSRFRFRFSHNLSSKLWLQFIREYTSKVDELIKDKLEAVSEVKAKEKEEKDMVAQQVASLNCTFVSQFLFSGV